MANPNPSPSTRFKKGNPGGPGKPLGSRSVTSRLRDLLENGRIKGKPIKDGKQVADLLAEALIDAALAGDLGSLKEILDRTEGKVPQATENNTKADIIIRVQYEDVGSGPAEAT